MPIVSIILPTYKDPPYITRAVESVLKQSFSGWELIIVDDGLTGGAIRKVQNFVNSDKRIKLVSNPRNLGIQKSLNRGISVAQGQFIARIDQDDIWIDQDKLKKQITFMDLNPDYVLVGTDAIICDENLVDLQSYSMPKSNLEIRNRILFKNCFLHSAILARKSALDKVGEYTEGKKVLNVEDYDLWLRLGGVGKITNLDFKSVKIIVHDDTITAKNRVNQAYRDILLTLRYRKKYPYFIFAILVGCLRLLFFCFNNVFPVSKKYLYKIQALYKSI